MNQPPLFDDTDARIRSRTAPATPRQRRHGPREKDALAAQPSLEAAGPLRRRRLALVAAVEAIMELDLKRPDLPSMRRYSAAGCCGLPLRRVGF